MPFSGINGLHQNTHIYKFLLVVSLVLFCSCKKFIDVPSPITSVTGQNVFNSNTTAAAVLTGVYTDMSSSDFNSGGYESTSFFLGMAADELVLYSKVSNPTYTGYYSNALTSLNVNSGATDFWNKIYPTVYIINAAIEGLTASTSLTPDAKEQLLGEAKFLRAFSYFYLANLYGDVPLVLSSDYSVNSVLSRSSKADVYKQIIIDLKDSQNLLKSYYVDATSLNSTNKRVRPNKWAATALLARAYLYTEDWTDAEKQSTEVINNTEQYSMEDLNNVFLDGSKEAIWQLQPVNVGQNTQDARTFVLSGGPNDALNPVYLSNFLLDNFENGDKRKSNWTGSFIDTNSVPHKEYFYAYKYKVASLNAPVTEYLMVMRLAEQYLIRAEARAQLGKISESASDLNVIRNRAGLSNTIASSKSDLLPEIQHERQVEFFTEWGHRWLDLKRTNTVNNVMENVTPQKGGTWNQNWALFPIPLSEILTNPSLKGHQNPGYN